MTHDEVVCVGGFQRGWIGFEVALARLPMLVGAFYPHLLEGVLILPTLVPFSVALSDSNLVFRLAHSASDSNLNSPRTFPCSGQLRRTRAEQAHLLRWPCRRWPCRRRRGYCQHEEPSRMLWPAGGARMSSVQSRPRPRRRRNQRQRRRRHHRRRHRRRHRRSRGARLAEFSRMRREAPQSHPTYRRPPTCPCPR